MGSMGKGMMWINGQSIGRHWPANLGKGKCEQCHYAGMFTETKCLSDCDKPSQKWSDQRFLCMIQVLVNLHCLLKDVILYRYHVPRSWLKPTGNLLVVFEEWGGDPKWISLVKRTVN